MNYKKKCKFNLYTCSNLSEYLHCKELCKLCTDGDAYQHIDDFKTVIKTIKAKKKQHETT